MKKHFFKLVSLVLALALVFGAVAVGTTAQEPECDKTPVVILPGINHSKAYVADENGEPKLNKDGKRIEGQTVIIDTSDLLPFAIPRAIVPLLLTLIFQTDIGWSDAVTDIAERAFKWQAADDEGNTYENIEVYRYGSLASVSEDQMNWFRVMLPIDPLCDAIGKDHVYFFTFNLAGDPMQSAKELDEYIQMVKEETGHDQVDFLPVSLGGTLLTAYVEQFKDKNDVRRIVNAVAVLNGTNIIDDFYKREWNLDDEFIYNEFLPIIMEESGDKDMGYLISIALRILPKDVLYSTLTSVYDVLYNTMLLKIPQFWAMCSKETYAEIIDSVLPKDKYPVLRAKTDAFQQARINLESNLKYMKEKYGVEINNIVGYSLATGDVTYSFFKIAKSTNSVNSDSIINVESTSLGATCALPGEQLRGITSPTDQKYLSPDREICAADCAFPDNTWFYKDMHHEDTGNSAPIINLVLALLVTDEITDVWSNPEKYPQFNFGTNNKRLRRWNLPDCYKAREMEGLTAEQSEVLEAAIAQAEAVMAATIGNQADVDAATLATNNALAFCGYGNYSTKEPEVDTGDSKPGFFEVISTILFKVIGGKGFSDIF